MAEWTRVTVRASSGLSGGRRPGSRSASIVLPEPGGPIIKRWCGPAAATSRARRPRAWPRTRPGRVPGRIRPGGVPVAAPAMRTGPAAPGPARSALPPRGPARRARAPPRARRRGCATRPDGAVASARAIMPGTWRSAPLRPTSPQKANPSVRAGLISPVATRRPTAMGRSRPAPPLRTPDGTRLTVTRRRGQGSPLERTAARTRSRASRTAASGSPTMVKPGSPLETSTSTETRRPRAPLSVADATAASMRKNGRARGRIKPTDLGRSMAIGGQSGCEYPGKTLSCWRTERAPSSGPTRRRVLTLDWAPDCRIGISSRRRQVEHPGPSGNTNLVLDPGGWVLVYAGLWFPLDTLLLTPPFKPRSRNSKGSEGSC